MEEWKELSLHQLKKLAKGRAGRIAELQMELKIIEGIIEAKIKSGNFSGKEIPEKEDAPRKPEPEPSKEQKPQTPQQAPEEPKPQEPLIRPAAQPAQQQSLGEEKKHPGFEKKEEPKSSNPHAFKEID